LRDLESDATARIYVKGHEKKKWLADIAGEVAEQYDLAIETIDADYEDIGPLRTLALLSLRLPREELRLRKCVQTAQLVVGETRPITRYVNRDISRSR